MNTCLVLSDLWKPSCTIEQFVRGIVEGKMSAELEPFKVIDTATFGRTSSVTS